MNKKNFSWIIGVLVSVAIVASFLLTTSKNESTQESITIGVILPMTGSLGILGQNEARLLRASATLINERPNAKYKIHLDIQDAALDGKKAAAAANLFASKQVPIVMISTSPLAAPVIPITEQNGQMSVIHSMTEALLRDTRLSLRIYPGIRDEVKVIGNWLQVTPDEKRLFSLRLNAEWSEKWVEEFKISFPHISIVDETYSMQRTNVRDSLAKLKSKNPTHILLLGYGQEYPSIIKQIREAGIDLPIIGNIGFIYAGTREAARKTGNEGLLAGCVFPYLSLQVRSPDYLALQQIYRQENGGDLLQEPGALYFFDTLKLIANAIDEIGLEPKKIREHILNRQNPYMGITGQLKFNTDGNVEIPLSMAKFDDAGVISSLLLD